MTTTLLISALPNCVQAAIYPVLAGHYIVKSLDSEAMPRQLFSELVLLVVVFMRLFDFSGLTKYVWYSICDIYP